MLLKQVKSYEKSKNADFVVRKSCHMGDRVNMIPQTERTCCRNCHAVFVQSDKACPGNLKARFSPFRAEKHPLEKMTENAAFEGVNFYTPKAVFFGFLL